jgi:hypothetical protein
VAATQLGIYNAALLHLGQRALSSVAEDNESRRVLDNAYSNVVAECLAAGQWNFAKRTVQVESDTGITPNFGHREVFSKPTDWVRTLALADDEYLQHPLSDLAYKDEGATWLTDVTPIYVTYVSNDTGYGMDLTQWPQPFVLYVELVLAERVCMKLTASEALSKKLALKVRFAKRNALNFDVMNEGIRLPPAGSVVTARLGGNSRRDRGRRDRLTG